MSILETKHSRPADIIEEDRRVAAATSAPVSPARSIPVHGATRARRIVRFFAAVRHSNAIATGGVAFADPRIYEEYRAGVARRERDREAVRYE